MRLRCAPTVPGPRCGQPLPKTYAHVGSGDSYLILTGTCSMPRSLAIAHRWTPLLSPMRR